MKHRKAPNLYAWCFITMVLLIISKTRRYDCSGIFIVKFEHVFMHLPCGVEWSGLTGMFRKLTFL